MKEQISITKFMLFLIFMAVAGGATVIFIELYEANAIAKSRFAFDINQKALTNSKDTAIGNDIIYHHPLLINHKGRWQDEDINDYLGFYELIMDYMEAGSLTYRDVFDAYSEDVIAAYNNKEIQQYIADARKEGNSNEFFIKFEKLAKKFIKTNEVLK